ncbi:DUF4365 domain-containing protein [Glycomyces tarimensis]
MLTLGMQDIVLIGIFRLRWLRGDYNDGKDVALSFPPASGSPLDLSWTLPHNNWQGNYGEAVVKFIVASAGLTGTKPEMDVGWDLQVAGVNDLEGDIPEARFKTKATRVVAEKNGDLRYRLEVRDINHLVGPHRVPRYLALVIAPENPGAYVREAAGIQVAEIEAYWASFEDLAPVTGVDPKTKRTVSVPKCNLLTPAAMRGLCARGLAQEEIV